MYFCLQSRCERYTASKGGIRERGEQKRELCKRQDECRASITSKETGSELKKPENLTSQKK